MLISAGVSVELETTHKSQWRGVTDKSNTDDAGRKEGATSAIQIYFAHARRWRFAETQSRGGLYMIVSFA